MKLGVVVCSCNPATFMAEFQNDVDLIPVGGSSPSIGGWIAWPPKIQHKVRNLTKYWDLTKI